jgi:hypothetical protein
MPKLEKWGSPFSVEVLDKNKLKPRPIVWRKEALGMEPKKGEVFAIRSPLGF